jgi:hypothetical protein
VKKIKKKKNKKKNFGKNTASKNTEKFYFFSKKTNFFLQSIEITLANKTNYGSVNYRITERSKSNGKYQGSQ